MLEDRKIRCEECHEEFDFTVGEQMFYAEKGLANDPKRCKRCRNIKKKERRKRSKVMHTVICDECGKETQVPFEPTNGLPVYCDECFKLHPKQQ